MTRVHRVAIMVGTAFTVVWGVVYGAFVVGHRQAAASRQRLNAVRRRYALGAASREQFEAAVRQLGPAARRALRGAGRRRRPSDKVA
jgi:hypothetical protein